MPGLGWTRQRGALRGRALHSCNCTTEVFHLPCLAVRHKHLVGEDPRLAWSSLRLRSAVDLCQGPEKGSFCTTAWTVSLQLSIAADGPPANFYPPPPSFPIRPLYPLHLQCPANHVNLNSRVFLAWDARGWPLMLSAPAGLPHNQDEDSSNTETIARDDRSRFQTVSKNGLWRTDNVCWTNNARPSHRLRSPRCIFAIHPSL